MDDHLRNLERTAAERPSDPEPLRALARAHERGGDPEQAWRRWCALARLGDPEAARVLAGRSPGVRGELKVVASRVFDDFGMLENARGYGADALLVGVDQLIHCLDPLTLEDRWTAPGLWSGQRCGPLLAHATPRGSLPELVVRDLESGAERARLELGDSEAYVRQSSAESGLVVLQLGQRRSSQGRELAIDLTQGPLAVQALHSPVFSPDALWPTRGLVCFGGHRSEERVVVAQDLASGAEQWARLGGIVFGDSDYAKDPQGLLARSWSFDDDEPVRLTLLDPSTGGPLQTPGEFSPSTLGTWSLADSALLQVTELPGALACTAYERTSGAVRWQVSRPIRNVGLMALDLSLDVAYAVVASTVLGEGRPQPLLPKSYLLGWDLDSGEHVVEHELNLPARDINGPRVALQPLNGGVAIFVTGGNGSRMDVLAEA